MEEYYDNFWNMLDFAKSTDNANSGGASTASGSSGAYSPTQWANPKIQGSYSSAPLLDYRPWEADYWETNLPQQSGLLSMQAPPSDYSISYLPGEFRDPITWRKWADDHKGHIPEGKWVTDQSKWPGYSHQGTPGDNPWRFTSPGGGSNIAQTQWSAPSLGSGPAFGWQGFLSGLGGYGGQSGWGSTPLVATTTQTILGV